MLRNALYLLGRKPGHVLDIAAVLGNSQLRVSWSPPLDRGDGIGAYAIRWGFISSHGLYRMYLLSTLSVSNSTILHSTCQYCHDLSLPVPLSLPTPLVASLSSLPLLFSLPSLLSLSLLSSLSPSQLPSQLSSLPPSLSIQIDHLSRCHNTPYYNN